MKKFLLVLILSLVLSGCAGIGVGTKKGPKADGTFAEGKLVEDFPTVPAYPGMTVIESYGFEGNFGLSAMSVDELSKVVNFYGPGLTQVGWQNTLKKSSDTNFEYEISNDEFRGRVIINTAADGKSTAISLSIEPRKID